MNRRVAPWRKTTLWCLAVCGAVCATVRVGAEEISFNRDVRPILASRCFSCHGPDEESREAELRLDLREIAIREVDGRQAIAPARPDQSELLLRVTTTDSDVRMPPEGKPLTERQVDILRQWIADGAPYDKHWAFAPPRRPALPTAPNDWPRNPIDDFVAARLEKERLTPSPEASRYELVRRVYLDLIGLPPTVQQANAFATSQDPQAYEALVDQLLGSKHYGERWARLWLDLARYADTNGYEKDRPRSIWPYRDWVIQALNADTPFDQFTIEQLAGDMLPDATLEQRIATGFHRNTMLNEEGGIDPLEFRYYAMVDRVATTGLVWLGLTTGSAQCHSHKYDPISHGDYYRLMALLDNADEVDLVVPDDGVEKRRAELLARILQLEDELVASFPTSPASASSQPTRDADEASSEPHRQAFEAAFDAWLLEQRGQAIRWLVVEPVAWETNLPKLDVLSDGSLFSRGDITKRDVFRLTFDLAELARQADATSRSISQVTALRLEALPDQRLPAGGPGRAFYEGRKGDFFLSELGLRHDQQSVALKEASHSYGKISIGNGTADAANVLDGDGSTGWSTAEAEGEPHQLVVNLAAPLPLDGKLDVELLFERHFAASLGRFRISLAQADRPIHASRLPVALEQALAAEVELSEETLEQLRRHFLRTTELLAEQRKPIDKLRKQLPKPTTTMVMLEREADNPRVTHLHHRGEYLSPREPVEPATPQLFPPLAADQPSNRLALARWLVSDSNPLAARVAVNRAWRAFFGRGLVHTSGDFGTQSAPPSHPELLDWLACELREQGWSLKKLHRLIVTSATYRQQAAASHESRRLDPENRLLSRGPRFRLEAEMVRDSMLHAAGLLSDRVGGPSVFPPQPSSVTALAYGQFDWKVSDPYRRSLYTFSKRTAPFAAYLVFDAPTGEECLVRRDRSNTPLQALTLLNDPMYVELAQAAAARAFASAADDLARLQFLFQSFSTRPPEPAEEETLLQYLSQQRHRLQQGELSAQPISGQDANPDLAAWTLTARVIMNLDEAVVR